MYVGVRLRGHGEKNWETVTSVDPGSSRKGIKYVDMEKEEAQEITGKIKMDTLDVDHSLSWKN